MSRPRPWLGSAALAILGLLGSCAPTSTTARGEPTAGSADLDQAEADLGEPVPIPAPLMAELVAEAERVRQLRAREPVVGVSLDEALLRQHIADEVARSHLDVAEKIMRAFGFLPEGSGPLGPTLAQLLGDEVIGLYDPREDRLMVRRDIALGLGSNSAEEAEARGVLVHEVVHALQDQSFETLERSSDDAWADDELSALDCLAEGDATLAMILATMAAAGVDDSITMSEGFGAIVRRLGQEAAPESPAMASAPPYFGYVMSATYFDGAAFAAELRRQGGWAAVDRAHREPPAGTFHVMDPARYLAGERPHVVTLPETLPGLAPPDWQPVRAATLGEIETGAFLLPAGDGELARSGARGWLGDRFVVYEGPGGALALAWRLRFTDEAAADRFVDLARDAEVGSGRGGCEEPPPDASGRRLLTCAQGSDLLAREGREVAVARGVPVADGPALVEALLAASVAEAAPRDAAPAQ